MSDADHPLTVLLRREARRLASQDVAQTIAELEPLLEEEAEADRGLEAVWHSLWIAISERMSTGVVECLLSYTRTSGWSLEAKCSSLLLTAAETSNADTVLLLLSHGADANVRGRFDMTPLHCAAGSDSPDICGLLLDHGADIDARCWGGFTPVHVATECHHPDVVVLLRQRGALVDFKPAVVDRFPQAMARQLADLRRGGPAYLEVPAVGRYSGNRIYAVDEETGLPVRQIKARFGPELVWLRGERAALKKYIRDYGLPWNSRLPWIEMFKEPVEYRRGCFQRGEAQTFTSPGQRFRSPDGQMEVRLSEENERWILHAQHSKLNNSSASDHRESPSAGRSYGSGETTFPLLRGAREVSLCWGPENSCLALIRYSYVRKGRQRARHCSSFVLDLGLGCWIPARTVRAAPPGLDLLVRRWRPVANRFGLDLPLGEWPPAPNGRRPFDNRSSQARELVIIIFIFIASILVFALAFWLHRWQP